MSFKNFYTDRHLFDSILIEGTSNEEKISIETEAKKAGIFDKLNTKDILKAASATKDKLNSEETRKSVRLLGTVLTAVDGITAAFKSGKGGSGTTGGGIFTSILRYNNPILKKITPEKESLDAIEQVVRKMNFKSDTTKIITMAKFKVLFTKFLKEHPLPDEETYNYLHDILSEITGMQVTKKNIRDDAFEEELPPKTKETAAQKKKRVENNKKGLAEEKKYIKDWNISFRNFLDNKDWSSEVHDTAAPLFSEFGIKVKMNTEEIKDDLGKLFTRVFTREVLQFLSSMTKVGKNFVIVAISVYLMKIIKRIAFS